MRLRLKLPHWSGSGYFLSWMHILRDSIYCFLDKLDTLRSLMPSRDRSFHANFGMLPQWVQKLESSRRFEGLISDPIRDMLQVDANLRM